MRAIRAITLTSLGALAGIVAAAPIVKRAVPSSGDEQSDEIALVAIFDGIELESRAKAFRGGSILAWFGGVDLDLREAALAPRARLSVRCLFGGVSIRVPPDWRIESSARAFAGGVQVSPQTESAGPSLAIDGLVLFGGIAVGARDRGQAGASSRDG